ncbi:MAG: enoyl-CoA hydratase/isomerase family protein, partial [Lacisediminimonas sp.]|nr:enoyl-CoA hydratase/isomerase family protein [Lacisediminimonas sp.]
ALRIGFVSALCASDKWDDAIASALAAAGVLDEHSRAQLYHALGSRTQSEEMALLVRSAARPGLKQRVARYLAAA